MDLATLIAKLEAATEGSWELDNVIWRFGWEHKWFEPSWRYDAEDPPYYYTQSVDAALTLVAPKADWSLLQVHGQERPSEASVYTRPYMQADDELHAKFAAAATPALALCIAALKAREA